MLNTWSEITFKTHQILIHWNWIQCHHYPLACQGEGVLLPGWHVQLHQGSGYFSGDGVSVSPVLPNMAASLCALHPLHYGLVWIVFHHAGLHVVDSHKCWQCAVLHSGLSGGLNSLHLWKPPFHWSTGGRHCDHDGQVPWLFSQQSMNEIMRRKTAFNAGHWIGSSLSSSLSTDEKYSTRLASSRSP